MDYIAGYDSWKLASPYVEDIEIDVLERTLAACPFCGRRPFFEDSAHDVDVFVSCQCGASIRGSDWQDVAAKWSARPIPVARKVLRDGPRAYWPGA